MQDTGSSVRELRHVVVLVDQFPKISETFVLNHILGLLERNIEVDIFAKDASLEPLQHRSVNENRLLGRTHVISSRRRQTKRLALLRGLFAATTRYPKALRHLSGFRIDSNFVLALAATAGLRDVVQIVHAHFGPNGLLASKLIDSGAFPGAKLVTSFHGYDATSYVTQHGRECYAELFASGDAFIANGKDMRDRLLRLGCEARKIAVVPIGVDPPALQERSHTTHLPTRILSIGRLVEKKGHSYGLRAVAEVAKRYPDIEYHIIGEGPLREPLDRLVRYLGLQKNVTFCGIADADSVAAALDRADVLLTPSVTASNGDSEGMVVANMEAMARKIAVVSTRHGSIPELIDEGISGLLCEEGDVRCLSRSLLAVIENDRLRDSLGRGGRAKIVAEHDRRRLEARLVDIYNRLLRGLSPT